MEDLLRDGKFQKSLKQIAFQAGESLEEVKAEAEGYLKELHSEHQPMSNLMGMQAAQYILSRGYDKTIDVNPAEIKKLTKLMRRNSVAFVMTHKTYIDMFVLAVVLTRHGMPLPFTFAGINLNLMGIGHLAKSTGVIFIRRSIKDNVVYKATLRHFIGDLVKKKEHFMWAIEGTRSRTGKLVWPKMGILKYIMDASDEIKQEVKYVPVSIVYDLIPDVKEMTQEGRGKKKQAESLSWLVNYVKKMGDNYGRIALRFGDPVQSTSGEDGSDISKVADYSSTIHGLNGRQKPKGKTGSLVFRHAFELVHKINQITPVTTASLICISLLSKFALGKRAIESDVVHLMKLIEEQKPDALVDRGKAIGESVQTAILLLRKAEIVRQKGEGLKAKYIIASDNYLPATYYANMSVHHLYHRAFIELALLKIADVPIKGRMLAFWEEIMQLRDLFKFEFFYSQKKYFSDEIESNLKFIDPKWKSRFRKKEPEIKALLNEQEILVTPVVLFTYIEAYRVIAQGLLTWESDEPFDEGRFVEDCLFIGEEMQWQGKIQRIESVSKPFIVNGIRLIKNAGLVPEIEDRKVEKINSFINRLDELSNRIKSLQSITLSKPVGRSVVPIAQDIVPGSKTDSLTKEIIKEESGAHIGAFFDLDRTLIKGFSAKEFFQSRLLSGKITSKELIAQFAGVIVYATGNGNFAGLAAIGAKGIKGIKEEVFVQLGEEVYNNHLADTIFPESRALVSAHLAKGHTVAIISAATPYQVTPIARDLGIDEIMCTRMEVKGGKFTGAIVEPACWGEGKAIAARELAKKYKLDLSKSYFYTDSVEDLALLEIVGQPRPLNPDPKLSALAFKNDWPVARFTDESTNVVTQFLRTGLAVGATLPAALTGLAVGGRHLSWNDGINSMMANVGDLVTMMAGIHLAVKGEEYLWSHRPAVFIFNHQSNADLFIAAKLVRKNVRGVAKKELQMTPILGQLMMVAGVIFVDRGDREKAIEAMKPAVDSLKNGTSVLIFPEGTRSYDYNLGPFKKGAFHLAMQAGVPLIPVVVKNAHDAMPRGTNIFRPAQVDVVVLPPVFTKGWNKKNLNKNIKDVRNLFLKELGQELEA